MQKQKILRIAMGQVARNALRDGFVPAWAEMTVKTKLFIEEKNR